jgi:hypothetical protein
VLDHLGEGRTFRDIAEALEALTSGAAAPEMADEASNPEQGPESASMDVDTVRPSVTGSD